MEQFLDKVAAVNDVINTFVWVKIGIIILLGVGIVTTVCTKFFQLSHLGLWWKNTIGSLFRKHVIGHTKDKGAISPFQALCTALAASTSAGYSPFSSLFSPSSPLSVSEAWDRSTR